MLGQRASVWVRDPCYEYDAPSWCDFSLASLPSSDVAASAWFAVKHPSHDPLEPTPPPQSMLSPHDSPYKSPAPSPAAWSKVSPGPSRLASAAAAVASSARRTRKSRAPTSPIPHAIQTMLTSNTPHKLVATAGGATHTPHKLGGGFGTPHKLLGESASRLPPRTPVGGSAQKALLAGAQRVVHPVAHKMVFDTIDESNSPPNLPAAQPMRSRGAKRVSMATQLQMPPPSPANASLFASTSYSTTKPSDENAPANAPAAVQAVAGSMCPPAPITKRRAPAAVATTATTATTTRKRRSNEVATSTIATPPSTSGAPLTRKRRSNEAALAAAAAAPLLDLDPELELMLSAHNRAVAAEQAQEDELAVVLALHNKSLLQSGLRSPTTSHTSSSANTNAPGSGNKAPKKKMRTGTTPPAAAATTTRARKSMRPATASSTTTAATARATRSRKSVAPSHPSSSSTSPATTTLRRSGGVVAAAVAGARARSRSAYRSEQPAVEQQDTDELMTDATEHAPTAAGEDEHEQEQDISFSVSDLGLDEHEDLPVPLVAPNAGGLKSMRKSMGKALRATAADQEEDETMLDDLIVLDEPIAAAPKPAVANQQRRTANVSFTAAAVTTTTKAPSRPTTAGTRKAVAITTGGLTARNMNAPLATNGTTKKSKLATTTGAKTPSTAAPTKKTTASSGGAMGALISRARAAPKAVPLAFLLPEDDEIAALLSAHNHALRPKVRYTPRTHAAATVKAWEQALGKRWYELPPGEREDANAQMDAMVAAGL